MNATQFEDQQLGGPRANPVCSAGGLAVILGVSLIAHMAFFLIGQSHLSDWRWPHLAAHAAIETCGAVAAIWCAWMLIGLERRGVGTSFNFHIAAAMVAMGLLDGFHAICDLGNNFVWLHSVATFVGGTLFALVWVTPWWSPKAGWILTVAAGVAFLATGSYWVPDLVPRMIANGNFTFAAGCLNVVGGIFMFAATVKLGQSYFTTGREDDLLFCIHCLLFGLAAVMFEQSTLWDLSWWGWHALRLAAYAVAVAMIVMNDPQQDLARLNNALRQQRATLERRVLERTAELREKEQHANAASQAKSEFLANMSHEIRTPMTAIIGYSELLTDFETSEQERLNAARTIQRNGRLLLAIINDILDLSKIEAGKIDVERRRIPVAELVYDVCDLLEERATSLGNTLTVESRGDVPEFITSDPTRLKQALLNLVSNAVKFTKSGSVRIIIELNAAEERLSFDIVDTGIGIKPEQLNNIFETFGQADSSTTRRFGGTGLGLAITERIARLLDGHVRCCSEFGVGTTFRFAVATGSLTDVPMLSSIERSGDTVTVSPEEPVERPKLESSVLLVEDGPDNRRLITHLLRKAGAEVTVAENGKEGLDCALQAWEASTPFDVILMDMQMPVMDGYAATRALRERGYPGQVLALTAHAMAADAIECQQAGCDTHLSKPIDRELLIAEIASRVGVQSSWQALAGQ